MDDWPRDELRQLAPTIDEAESKRMFERTRVGDPRRRAPFLVAAAVIVLVGAGSLLLVAQASNDDQGDEDARAALDQPAFEIISRGGDRTDDRTLAAATSVDELVELLGDDFGAAAAVDFRHQIVVALAVPRDLCQPELTGFDVDGRTLTPEFIASSDACPAPTAAEPEPRFRETWFVALDRAGLSPSFTLRLPAEQGDNGNPPQLEVMVPPARSVPEQPAFQVLAEGDNADQPGTLRSAINAAQLDELWTVTGIGGDVPNLDFDQHVVVSFSTYGTGRQCPAVFDGFDLDGRVWTPRFVEGSLPEDQDCDDVAIPRTYVVAADRTAATPGFTLRLLDSYLEDPPGERRLQIEVPVAERVPLCSEIPEVTTDVIGPNVGGENIDPIYHGVVNTYIDEHRDTYAGSWIDRDAGGTLVIAFTDDPQSHLVELAQRRPQDSDRVSVEPRPPIVDDRPIGEWDQTFDVVQVEFTEAELEETRRDIAAQIEDTEFGVTNDVRRNRVAVIMDTVTEDELTQAAEAVPADRTCVDAQIGTPDRQPYDPGDSIDVIVERRPDGSVPSDTLVACQSLVFPMAALDQVVPIEQADVPGVQKALDRFLAGDEGRFWPQRGWKLLTRSDDEIQLIHADQRSVDYVVFEPTRAGWAWAGGGGVEQCALRTVLPHGLGDVRWRLDPAFDQPNPGSAEIHLLVTEQDCASGRPMGDRLLGPDIVETHDAVLIAFAAIEQTSGQDCPSNPSTPVTVQLPSPLGDRRVRDGLIIAPNLDALLR